MQMSKGILGNACGQIREQPQRKSKARDHRPESSAASSSMDRGMRAGAGNRQWYFVVLWSVTLLTVEASAEYKTKCRRKNREEM